MAYKRPRAVSPSESQKRPRGGAAFYISLGTQLPDEDGDDGAFVPVWKQTVTDERGRRRLHGAFTGGFSAGYFNTVGSKEGWTPKAFVSSRAHRIKDQANGQIQRAEDFMDDEDRAAAAETRQLETAQTFAGVGDAGQDISDGVFGLFLNQEETMGVKIAQKMGWRRDQGIGRKIHRDARLGDVGGATKDGSIHFFAPEDARTMVIPQGEVRRKGLGYASEVRLSADAKCGNTRPEPKFHFLEESKTSLVSKKLATKKSSFGVGVLNDTGSDDEDPYDLGPKISFNRTLGKEKKTAKASKFAKVGQSDKHVFVSKKGSSRALVSLSRPSRDGRQPLKGFVLATDVADVVTKSRYPPPEIPFGWKSAKGSITTAESHQYQSTADAAKASTLDVKGRSALLGEKSLPGKSVFDFISKDARDRLAAISGKTDLPQGLGQAAPEGHLPVDKAPPKDLWSLVPSLEKGLAAGALAKGATGWMPYAEDLSKRRRYVGFLELRAGLKDDLPERPHSFSITEWVKELQEFAHAAQVFKPTTGIMASRFTSSSSSISGTSGSDPLDERLLRQPLVKPEDPAEQAARLGMYGAMTRSSIPFHPSRLLCKRFNVKPPPDLPLESDHNESGFKPPTEEAVSKSAMDKMLHELLTNGSVPQRPAWMGAADTSAESDVLTQHVEHAQVDVERNEALQNARAPEEVFKAIFGDDSDDD
ncbi:hypothetical protein ACN47E_010134 [Coniothyrium glycines]